MSTTRPCAKTASSCSTKSAKPPARWLIFPRLKARLLPRSKVSGYLHVRLCPRSYPDPGCHRQPASDLNLRRHAVGKGEARRAQKGGKEVKWKCSRLPPDPG